MGRQYKDIMTDHIHTYEVPTFRDDHRTLKDNRAIADPIAYDAFLHYSEDEVRMRTLSGDIGIGKRRSDGGKWKRSHPEDKTLV